MKIRQRNSLRFIKRFVSINSLLPSLKLNCMRATTCHRIQSIFSLVLRHKMKRISNFSYFEQFFFLVSQCKYKIGILCTQKEKFLCSKKKHANGKTACKTQIIISTKKETAQIHTTQKSNVMNSLMKIRNINNSLGSTT